MENFNSGKEWWSWSTSFTLRTHYNPSSWTHKRMVSRVRPRAGPCHHGNTVLRVENTTELWDLWTVVKHPQPLHLLSCSHKCQHRLHSLQLCLSIKTQSSILSFSCAQTKTRMRHRKLICSDSVWTREGPFGRIFNFSVKAVFGTVI